MLYSFKKSKGEVISIIVGVLALIALTAAERLYERVKDKRTNQRELNNKEFWLKVDLAQWENPEPLSLHTKNGSYTSIPIPKQNSHSRKRSNSGSTHMQKSSAELGLNKPSDESIQPLLITARGQITKCNGTFLPKGSHPISIYIGTTTDGHELECHVSSAAAA